MFILKRKIAFFNEIQSIEKHASIATCYIGRLYSFLKPYIRLGLQGYPFNSA